MDVVLFHDPPYLWEPSQPLQIGGHAVELLETEHPMELLAVHENLLIIVFFLQATTPEECFLFFAFLPPQLSGELGILGEVVLHGPLPGL
jgi:hypothetical protein